MAKRAGAGRPLGERWQYFARIKEIDENGKELLVKCLIGDCQWKKDSTHTNFLDGHLISAHSEVAAELMIKRQSEADGPKSKKAKNTKEKITNQPGMYERKNDLIGCHRVLQSMRVVLSAQTKSPGVQILSN